MTELLTDPGHIRQDLQTIHTALVKKWELPDALLAKLPMVMAQIAIKGKPKEQIAATKNLMLMKDANDKADTRPEKQPQTTINVGVSVDNRTDSGRDPLLAIGERIQAARVLRQPGG
tara:strand:- start:2564 stop:2914 length:351 start_codon:yes stop_codon:yes gene_type:complete